MLRMPGVFSRLPPRSRSAKPPSQHEKKRRRQRLGSLPSRVPSWTLLTPPEPITAPRPDERAVSPPLAPVSGPIPTRPSVCPCGRMVRSSNLVNPASIELEHSDATLRHSTALRLRSDAACRATATRPCGRSTAARIGRPFGLPHTTRRSAEAYRRIPPKRPPLAAGPASSLHSVACDIRRRRVKETWRRR